MSSGSNVRSLVCGGPISANVARQSLKVRMLWSCEAHLERSGCSMCWASH